MRSNVRRAGLRALQPGLRSGLETNALLPAEIIGNDEALARFDLTKRHHHATDRAEIWRHSVADSQKILAAARKAVRAQAEGNGVVMVVSAMGHNTDALVDLAHEITDHPPAPRDGPCSYRPASK